MLFLELLFSQTSMIVEGSLASVYAFMDPICFVSTGKATIGGVMMCEIFSWHTLGPLIPISHGLNATARLSSENLHHNHHLQMVASSRTMHHCHKAQVG